VTAHCRACGERRVINVHHGACNRCVLRAKRMATSSLPTSWRGSRALLALARRFFDEIQGQPLPSWCRTL
jgi:hypothetical protein